MDKEKIMEIVEKASSDAIKDFKEKIGDLDDKSELIKKGYEILGIQVKVIADFSNTEDTTKRLNLVGKSTSLK